MKLLKEVGDEGLISFSQMMKVFLRLIKSLDDLTLNIPFAKSAFQLQVPKAIDEGCLNSSFLKFFGVDGDQNDEDSIKGNSRRKLVP